MQEGTKMIYDAMDALRTNNPDKNKTDLLSMIDRIEGKVTAMIDLADKMTAAIQTRDKEIARLLRALQAKDEKIVLYEQALEVACEEVEHQLILPEERYKSCILRHFTDPQNDCDEDCGVCLKEYFLNQGKQRIDMVKNNDAVRSEIDGRKRMDAQDQKKATLESLDDIVRRAEGLGRELEEKMRR